MPLDYVVDIEIRMVDHVSVERLQPRLIYKVLNNGEFYNYNVLKLVYMDVVSVGDI